MSDIQTVIRRDVLLAPYTTFRIGGPARFFAEPVSIDEFEDCIGWALDRGIQFFILGTGANILVSDAGYSGFVIHTGRLDRIEVEGTDLRAECGAQVDRLVDKSLEFSLTGLEFAAGLPGTLGGALFMNAKAFGGCFADVVYSVETLTARDNILKNRMLRKSELEFSYKRSVFQQRTCFIERAVLSLSHGSKERIRTLIEENRSARKKRGHYRYPNAGSIFKNDYGVGKPAGQLIDETGLKGTRIGDAEVYTKHGNFIINRGNATAWDVYSLIRLVRERVAERTGIVLETEIILTGDWKET
ncbi:MAG: UDP-N-acetylmuramate dehydrogenase [Spirochaetes bacterium]|nr:UDP-N-acetylmuramate dehydrogenase [Spirochaetota bacterium]